ncbi:hypothetical protein [Marvinbryantia formatexigens]|uniref:hypothetical protein n=1 Tax=Marvinbryantia formatexigens TaxID=168384 RepID=UPI0012F6C88A|nr:hypothetical protein [Marvinbryantia formatexigens]UWO25377.1 hypothetical protein NQ534_02470 [Marvinbryantia formatexigens DSM 14469]
MMEKTIPLLYNDVGRKQTNKKQKNKKQKNKKRRTINEDTRRNNQYVRGIRENHGKRTDTEGFPVSYGKDRNPDRDIGDRHTGILPEKTEGVERTGAVPAAERKKADVKSV